MTRRNQNTPWQIGCLLDCCRLVQRLARWGSLELFGHLEELLRIWLPVYTIVITAGVHQFPLSRLKHHLSLLFYRRAGRRWLHRNGVVRDIFGVYYLFLVLGNLYWSWRDNRRHSWRIGAPIGDFDRHWAGELLNFLLWCLTWNIFHVPLQLG